MSTNRSVIEKELRPLFRDFAPTASWETLRLRAALLRKLRTFFDQRGFLEIETPLMSHDTVIDRHLDPLPIKLPGDPRRPHDGARMWLQTSPEFAMKRLLVAGGEKIYQVTKAFRAGEHGTLHNPEFSMVEWYRVGDGLQQGMDLLAELAGDLLDAPRTDRLSYKEAFQRFVGLDPHTATDSRLARAAESAGLTPSWSPSHRDDWLDLLLAGCVEPHLGYDCPLILFDYPASQAALACVRDGDPPVAERFELYARGIELANGYRELVDADVLRARSRVANSQRLADGKYCLPEDNRLLRAMQQGLPPCAGVALGFDRLVMIAAGASCLRDVVAFPIDIA
ncbi:MAG: EF-P lysine aminoacylase EpmA [Pirellulaceae bacterium]